MKTVLATAVLAASSALVANAASAGSITDLTGKAGLASAHHYTTDDGVNVSVTATASAWGHTWDAKVGQYRSGLGISSYPCDSHQMDGNLAKETLNLTFDKDYVLEGVYFSYLDKNDNVEVLMEGSSVGRFGKHDIDFMGRGKGYLDLSSLNLSGMSFGLLAADCDDNFKVAGFEGHAAAVPTPSAALAGIVGIIGLAARRRRNAEQA